MFLYSSYHNSLSNLPPPSSLFSLHFTVSLFLSPLFLTTFCFQFIFLLFSSLYNYKLFTLSVLLFFTFQLSFCLFFPLSLMLNFQNRRPFSMVSIQLNSPFKKLNKTAFCNYIHNICCRVGHATIFCLRDNAIT